MVTRAIRNAGISAGRQLRPQAAVLYLPPSLVKPVTKLSSVSAVHATNDKGPSLSRNLWRGPLQ